MAGQGLGGRSSGRDAALIRSGLVCYTVLHRHHWGSRASGPLAGDTVQDLKTILLVEDNPNDVEPMLETLADYRLANDIVVVNDGATILDYPYWRGPFAGREPAPPAVALLDLEMPKVDRLAVLRTVKADPALNPSPS